MEVPVEEIEAKEDKMHATFKLKVTPETMATLQRAFRRLKSLSAGVQFDSFLRRICILTLEPYLTEYNRFGIAGHRVIWKIPTNIANGFKDEEGILELEEEAEFAKPVETSSTEAETVNVEITFPKRFFDMILDAAMYRNSYTREQNKRDKVSPPRIIYKTVGDWFKHSVFNPAIPLETRGDLLAMAEEESGAKRSHK